MPLNQDWKLGAAPVTAAAPVPSGGADKLNEEITKQGDLVRSLKAAKADKAKVDEAVRVLLGLKGQYKAATGQVTVFNGPSFTLFQKSRLLIKLLKYC